MAQNLGFCIYVGDLEKGPASQLWIGPILVTVAIQGVNQQMEVLSLSVTLK